MTEERTEKREEKKKKLFTVYVLSDWRATDGNLIATCVLFHSSRPLFSFSFVLRSLCILKINNFHTILFLQCAQLFALLFSFTFVSLLFSLFDERTSMCNIIIDKMSTRAEKKTNGFYYLFFFWKKNHYRYSKRIINGKANNAMQCCNTYIYGKQSNNAIKWDMH